MARMIEGREKKCTRRRTWLLWYVITFSSAPSHLMWSRRVPFLLWLFPSPQKYYCTSYLIKSVCTYCNLLRICLLIPTFEGARSITRLPHHRRRRKLYSSTPTDKAVRAFVRSSPYLRRTSSQSPPTLHSSDHRSEQAAPNLNLWGGGSKFQRPHCLFRRQWGWYNYYRVTTQDSTPALERNYYFISILE